MTRSVSFENWLRQKALETAITVEEVAKMAYLTESIKDNPDELEQHILDKHYLRKHGDNAYYGQKK